MLKQRVPALLLTIFLSSHLCAQDNMQDTDHMSLATQMIYDANYEKAKQELALVNQK